LAALQQARLQIGPAAAAAALQRQKEPAAAAAACVGATNYVQLAVTSARIGCLQCIVSEERRLHESKDQVCLLCMETHLTE
jgi:hypothetical protein